MELWRAQNIYYALAAEQIEKVSAPAKGESQSEAEEWRARFLEVGRRLNIAVEQFVARARDLAQAS